MTQEQAGTLKFDPRMVSKVPPDAGATDLVLIHTIMDASVDKDEPLVMHGKKLFDTDRPSEPVTLRDSELIRIAYQSGG